MAAKLFYIYQINTQTGGDQFYGVVRFSDAPARTEISVARFFKILFLCYFSMKPGCLTIPFHLATSVIKKNY